METVQEIETKYIQTSFGKLHFEEQGSPNGIVILCCHGDGKRSSWLAYEPIMKPLSELGYRVISFDMPGYGESEGKRFSYRNDSNTVLDSIFDSLKISNAIICGRSVGGKAAILYSIARPERVIKLVLTHPVVPQTSVVAQVSKEVLLTWAKDDSLGHPYFGPHGVAYLMKHIRKIELLSWTEKEWNGDIEKFYSTLFVSKVHEFITKKDKVQESIQDVDQAISKQQEKSEQ